MLGALLSSALSTAVAAISPTPEYMVDGEWLTRAAADGDVVWTRHVAGFEMEQVDLDTTDPAILVVQGIVTGPVSFGARSLVDTGEPVTYVVRFSAIDGAYLSCQIRR